MPRPSLHDLSPARARLCLEVKGFVQEELGVCLEGKHVLVGVSGGADSLGLLAVLTALSPALDMRLHVVHVDHGLREESTSDARFVDEVCRGWEIGCTIALRRVDQLAEALQIGLEEAGRKVRHEVFAEHLQKLGADWVAVGHTSNDLAEDVLMRLMRGAGWPELGGMAGADIRRRLLRPLLPLSRADLVGLLDELRQPWREDASNRDQAFLRNRVRHDVVPRFEQENPSFVQGMLRLWRLAQTDRDYFSGELAVALEACTREPNRIRLSRDTAEGLHPALRLRLFKLLLEELGPGQPLTDTLRKLEEALAQGGSGKTFQFPGRKNVRLERDHLDFVAENA